MADDQSGSLSSVGKAFSILDLFSIEQPSRTAEEIIGALKCSRPQGYRYIRDLCRAGFLVRFVATYRLGARAIELDYIVRQSDPLLHAAVSTMRELCSDSGCDVMLASLVGDRIMTIHHERGIDPTTVTYSRGRLLPRFRGAGSKAILAAMPLAQQRAFYKSYSLLEPNATLGASWDEVRVSLKAIRRTGAALSIGELDQQNVGVAAPIPDDTLGMFASLVMVLSAARWRTTDAASIIRVVQAAADRVADAFRPRPLPDLLSIDVTPDDTDAT